MAKRKWTQTRQLVSWPARKHVSALTSRILDRSISDDLGPKHGFHAHRTAPACAAANCIAHHGVFTRGANQWVAGVVHPAGPRASVGLVERIACTLRRMGCAHRAPWQGTHNQVTTILRKACPGRGLFDQRTNSPFLFPTTVQVSSAGK